MSSYEQAVFISYAWNKQSEAVINSFEKELGEHNIPFIRDKRNLKYRGSIKEFEERIGKGQCIVLFISDKFLKSHHCMYELLQIAANKQIQDRIFPIVLSDAKIFQADDQLDYVIYWENRIKKISEKIKSLDNLTRLEHAQEELRRCYKIRDQFSHITNILCDMNSLTPETHAENGFKDLLDQIKSSLESSKKRKLQNNKDITHQIEKPNHLIVYVSWSTIKKWKRSYWSERYAKARQNLPFAYASKQKRLFNLAHPGTVVWIISSPIFANYRLPPSLISRLKVNQKIDQYSIDDSDIQIPKAVKDFGRYLILADKNQSKYYPLNNAYQLLLSLEFEGKHPTLRNCKHCKKLYESGKTIYSGIPAHLQTIRQLAPKSEDTIEHFANSIDTGQVVFLSYRRKEAKNRAVKLVGKLSDKNFSCWYDNWMIPKPIAKGKIEIKEKLLSSILTDGLRQSTYFLALNTPTYHEKKWTEREWRRAVKEKSNPRRRRSLQLIEILMGGKASRLADIVIQDNGSDLAQQLIKAQAFKSNASQ